MRPVDSEDSSDGSSKSPPHKTPRLLVSLVLGLSCMAAEHAVVAAARGLARAFVASRNSRT